MRRAGAVTILNGVVRFDVEDLCDVLEHAASFSEHDSLEVGVDVVTHDVGAYACQACDVSIR